IREQERRSLQKEAEEKELNEKKIAARRKAYSDGSSAFSANALSTRSLASSTSRANLPLSPPGGTFDRGGGGEGMVEGARPKYMQPKRTSTTSTSAKCDDREQYQRSVADSDWSDAGEVRDAQFYANLDILVGMFPNYTEAALLDILETSNGSTNRDGSGECYFIAVDSKGQDVFRVMCYRENVERNIVQAILEGGHDTRTTLDEVQDMYADRLADFHCMDKEIFTLDFDSAGARPPTDNNQPTSPLTTPAADHQDHERFSHTVNSKLHRATRKSPDEASPLLEDTDKTFEAVCNACLDILTLIETRIGSENGPTSKPADLQEELSSSAEVEEEVGVNETKEECGVAKAAKHVTFADEVMEKVTVELTKVFAEAETETVSAAKDPVKEDVVAEETSGEVSAAVEISQASETKETKQTKEPKSANPSLAVTTSNIETGGSGTSLSREVRRLCLQHWGVNLHQIDNPYSLKAADEVSSAPAVTREFPACQASDRCKHLSDDIKHLLSQHWGVELHCPATKEDSIRSILSSVALGGTEAAREIAAMGSESTLADSGGDSSTESVISVVSLFTNDADGTEPEKTAGGPEFVGGWKPPRDNSETRDQTSKGHDRADPAPVSESLPCTVAGETRARPMHDQPGADLKLPLDAPQTPHLSGAENMPVLHGWKLPLQPKPSGKPPGATSEVCAPSLQIYDLVHIARHPAKPATDVSKAHDQRYFECVPVTHAVRQEQEPWPQASPAVGETFAQSLQTCDRLGQADNQSSPEAGSKSSEESSEKNTSVTSAIRPCLESEPLGKATAASGNICVQSEQVYTGDDMNVSEAVPLSLRTCASSLETRESPVQVNKTSGHVSETSDQTCAGKARAASPFGPTQTPKPPKTEHSISKDTGFQCISASNSIDPVALKPDGKATDTFGQTSADSKEVSHCPGDAAALKAAIEKRPALRFDRTHRDFRLVPPGKDSEESEKIGKDSLMYALISRAPRSPVKSCNALYKTAAAQHKKPIDFSLAAAFDNQKPLSASVGSEMYSPKEEAKPASGSSPVTPQKACSALCETLQLLANVLDPESVTTAKPRDLTRLYSHYLAGRRICPRKQPVRTRNVPVESLKISRKIIRRNHLLPVERLLFIPHTKGLSLQHQTRQEKSGCTQNANKLFLKNPKST
ncbi:hypothetical protein BaRGS_00030444, partial [Batillaria attramentaria]